MWFLSEFEEFETRDPLSPFLFVIVIEMLSYMVEAAVGGGFLNDFPMGNNLSISDLLFVDDTLFFCDAVNEHISALRAILLCFEVISGLKVNLEKSKLVSVGVWRILTF